VTKNKYDEELKSLKEMFPKRGALTIFEVANFLNVSHVTIRRGLKENSNVPSFRAIGTGKQKKMIRFPLVEVAKYIANTKNVDKNKSKVKYIKSDKLIVNGVSILDELKAINEKLDSVTNHKEKLGDE